MSDDCMTKLEELRALLEVVTLERDTARAELELSLSAWEAAGMQGRSAQSAMLALARERNSWESTYRAGEQRWHRSIYEEMQRTAQMTAKANELQAELSRVKFELENCLMREKMR
jgi:hypothetical protein